MKRMFLAGLPVTRPMVKTVLKIAEAVTVLYSATDTSAVSALLVTDSDDYTDYDCGTLLPGVQVQSSMATTKTPRCP